MSKPKTLDALAVKDIQAGRALRRMLLSAGAHLLEHKLYEGRHELSALKEGGCVAARRAKYNAVDVSSVLLCYINTVSGPEVFVSDGAIAIGPLDCTESVRDGVAAVAPDLSYTVAALRHQLEGDGPGLAMEKGAVAECKDTYTLLRTGAAISNTYWAAAELHVCPNEWDVLTLWHEHQYRQSPILFQGIAGVAAVVMPMRVN